MIQGIGCVVARERHATLLQRDGQEELEEDSRFGMVQ